jgi:hypothetical protein
MQFRFINIIKQLKNDKTILIVSLCVLGLILVTLLTSCGNKEQSVQPPLSVTVATTVPVVTTVPVPETTSAPTTTTMPDLSGVDWTALAREQYGKCGEWHDLAISVGWPEEEWKHLQQVIYRESRCQADAWNGADGGLTQINQIHTKWLSDMGWSHPNDMFDPEKNLTFAFRLWETSGWKPWRFSGSTFGD